MGWSILQLALSTEFHAAGRELPGIGEGYGAILEGIRAIGKARRFALPCKGGDRLVPNDSGQCGGFAVMEAVKHGGAGKACFSPKPYAPHRILQGGGELLKRDRV